VEGGGYGDYEEGEEWREEHCEAFLALGGVSCWS
jgi:hypothetical protein